MILCRCGDYPAGHKALPGGERGRCICWGPAYRMLSPSPVCRDEMRDESGRPKQRHLSDAENSSAARTAPGMGVDDDEWQLRNVVG